MTARHPAASLPNASGQGAGQSPSKLGNLADFFVLGILGLVPASALLAWGTDRSTASNAALVYLTIPIVTALLASVMVHERMTAVRWASLVVALAGVLILSGFDWRHLGLASGKYAFANVLILLACASSSFYNVFCKKLLSRFTPFEVLVFGYRAGSGDGPLDVPAHALGCEPGFGLRLPAAIPRRTDFFRDAQRKVHLHHDPGRRGDSGRHHPGDFDRNQFGIVNSYHAPDSPLACR